MGVYAVTGAASGIGQGIANAIRAEGHEVISIDIHNADINADLSDPAACEQAVNQIIERANGELDGFVPCAGVGSESNRPDLIPLVNYFSVVQMVNGLRPALAKKRGTIVLISSNSAQIAQYNEDYMQALLGDNREQAAEFATKLDGPGLYGGGKQALSRWMRKVSAEVAGEGVRMNAIAPGYTETAMTAAAKDDPKLSESIKAFEASIPVGRPGLPEDQANAVMFLLSDKASYICGSVLFVDGGHDAMFRPDRF